MVFGPDSELFHCDIYHALGCYWCLENGLFRTPRVVNGQGIITGYDRLLFPSVRMHSDNWLARKITDVLRMFLPKCMEKWVTSRSLRKGSTTTMAIHPNLDHKFVLLRSGHSSRDNDRFYIASTVAGSLPGFKVLSGWAHPHAPVYSPHLESLLLPTEILSYSVQKCQPPSCLWGKQCTLEDMSFFGYGKYLQISTARHVCLRLVASALYGDL
jgi:hypothetical protein